MNLSDGMHPNPKGIDHIASTMLPLARRLVELVKAR
jgi:lysophospholipase L1-like esterase